MTPPILKLERPAEHLIRRFHAGMLGQRTVRQLLEKRFSLVICCKDCPKVTEWTPPELERRFGAWPNLKLANLYPRLSCKGRDGCGAKEVALFPHLYGGEWEWPHPAA